MKKKITKRKRRSMMLDMSIFQLLMKKALSYVIVNFLKYT